MIKAAIRKGWVTEKQVRQIHDTLIRPDKELLSDMKRLGIAIKPGKTISFPQKALTGCFPRPETRLPPADYEKLLAIHKSLETKRSFGMLNRFHAGSWAQPEIEYELNPLWKAQIVGHIKKRK